MSRDYSVLLKPAKTSALPQEVPISTAFAHELEVVSTYANEITRNSNDLTGPLGATALLSDFSNGVFPNETLSASLLIGVAETAWPGFGLQPVDAVTTKPAKRLFKAFSETSYAQELIECDNGKTVSRWEYTSEFLADINTTEQYARKNRSRPAPGKSEALIGILNGNTLGLVEDKRLFLEPSAITTPAEMNTLLDELKGEGVNVEVPILKAVKTLDILMDLPKDERTLLRHIHDAESFYAPLCEFQGMDGPASALRSWASIARLTMTGHTAFIDKAAEIIDKLGSPEEVLASTERLLGELALGDALVDYAFRDTMGHGIVLGTAEIGVSKAISEQEAYARAIWRIKSIGSLSMKLLDDHTELLWKSDEEQRAGLAKTKLLPADLLGVTVVSDDTTVLAKLFAHSVSSIMANENISLTVSPSRTEKGKSIDIKGDDFFKQAMIGALALDPLNAKQPNSKRITSKNIDISGATTAYKAAKITCGYEGKRIEIQFQTEQARLESRIDLAAHAIYKLHEQAKMFSDADQEAMVSLTEEQVEGMRSIHARAKKLGQLGLIRQPDDSKRGKTFRRDIARVSVTQPGVTVKSTRGGGQRRSSQSNRPTRKR